MTSKEKARDSYLRRLYGITSKDYERMLKEQGYSCALCKRNQKEFKNRLAVEHNHKSGKVRSLCCFYCNKYRIGRNNLESATKLYEYMKRYDG